MWTLHQLPLQSLTYIVMIEKAHDAFERNERAPILTFLDKNRTMVQKTFRISNGSLSCRFI